MCRFKRIIPLLLLLFVALQSCMLTGKVDRMVSTHYARSASLGPLVAKHPSLSVNTDSLERINGYCKSKYKRFFMVPLLFYNYWGEKISCTINPRIYAARIVNALEQEMYAESAGNGLNGKSLEISFLKLPGTFYHNYNYHGLYLFYTTVSYRKSELYNFTDRLPAEKIRMIYTLRDSATGELIKRGEFIQWCEPSYLRKAAFENKNEFLANFISAYDENLKLSEKNITNEIMNEIKNQQP